MGFTVGYAFVLLYTSIGDILRIADAMKVKGLRLETRNLLTFLAAVPRMIIPAVFTIIRRANTMMAVMELRGFSAIRSQRPATLAVDRYDILMLVATMGVLAAAAAVRFGWPADLT